MSAYKVTINGNLDIYYVEADDIQEAIRRAENKADEDYGTKGDFTEFKATKARRVPGTSIGTGQ